MNCIGIEEIVIWVKIVASLATGFGVIIGIVQWRRSVLIKRAELIDAILEKFRTDANIRKAVYLLDYDQFWYTDKFHNRRGKEDYVDIGLEYFSYVCYLRKVGILRRGDFALFRYTIFRALSNLGIQDYFYNLYHFSRAQHADFPFPALLWFARKEKILYGDFYSSDAYKKPNAIFHRYLNF